MNLSILAFLSFFIVFFITNYILQDVILMDEFKAVFISIVFAIIIDLLMAFACIKLDAEAEKNYDKSQLTLDLIETINLSNESNIRIEKIFSNNPQDILYSINVTDGDSEIFLSARKNFEVINCTEDFKIEIYNSKYRYKKWIFYTEKNIKYYKIYFNKEKIKEISSTYLD